jgi:hypothetical protein
MNLNTLTKLYPTLTPAERVPLMLSAIQRGDQQEFGRLASAAPRQSWLITDQHGYTCALWSTALLELIEVLSLEMTWWMCGVLIWQWPTSPRAEELDELRRMIDGAPMLAYRCVIELDAWKRFCEELHVDAEVFWKDFSLYDLMKQSEDAVRRNAATPEEAASYLARHGKTEGPAVEAAVAGLRAVFDELRKPWEKP